jgi:adenylate cyclase
MDEDSYRVLGVPSNRAWPRALHARLLEKLRLAGVRRVAFDVLFLDQSDDGNPDQSLADALARVPAVIGAEQETARTQYGVQVETTLPYPPFRRAALPALVGFPEEHGYVRRFNLPSKEDTSAELLPLSFAAASLPASGIS